jgi:hypothetical protein
MWNTNLLFAGTVDELENLHPGIFGFYGGYSRAVAITNMSWMSGLLVGPILAGFMVERFGYLDLQCVLGKLYTSVAFFLF